MDTNGDCPICIESLNNGEEVVQLQPCKHFYHKHCLESTIDSNFKKCCLCIREYTNISKKSLTLNPYIPFTMILKSKLPLNNITNGTRVYRLKHSDVYETILNTNSIKVINNVIYIEISNYIKEANIKLNIEGIDKVLFNPIEFSYQGLNCISMFFTKNTGKCDVKEIKILIPQAMNEVTELWDMINSCLEARSDFKLTTTKFKNELTLKPKDFIKNKVILDETHTEEFDLL
jgi:hypothetical protein